MLLRHLPEEPVQFVLTIPARAALKVRQFAKEALPPPIDRTALPMEIWHHFLLHGGRHAFPRKQESLRRYPLSLVVDRARRQMLRYA